MQIFGDRKFVELPGDASHELPPLLVHASRDINRLDRVMAMANTVVDSEELIPGQTAEALELHGQLDRHRMDLAVQLVEQYLGFVEHWNWGDSVLEWIRQCEITFENRADLRTLLRPDIWPHAGRSSFVNLLRDKAVKTDGIDLNGAVGTRLSFRQPPPLKCFSNQFLFYLRSTVAVSAYETWANLSPEPVSSLPPERFHFQVVHMSLQ